MANRYIAFDVETPNCNNDRISSIGVAVVENGKITDTFSSLINPECRFDRFNISLTGIRPSSVRNAPTFPQLWTSRLQDLFSSGLLVAHNAPFDMRVLAHCLTDYHIQWQDEAAYACTVAMGRRTYPNLPDHRLDTMCRFLHIPLAHHRADSDAVACAMLLINYMEQGMVPESCRKTRSMHLQG